MSVAPILLPEPQLEQALAQGELPTSDISAILVARIVTPASRRKLHAVSRTRNWLAQKLVQLVLAISKFAQCFDAVFNVATLAVHPFVNPLRTLFHVGSHETWIVFGIFFRRPN